MSKIGKIPIEIKEGVSVNIENSEIKVSGPKGNLFYNLPRGIDFKIEDNKIILLSKNPKLSSLYGLTRAQIANMIKGVSEGFEKKLELTGVGYRAQLSGEDLLLSVGFSHSVKIKVPEGIKFNIVENKIIVSGLNKTLVGDTAAKIRAVRPPEPYKDKGISYVGERIRRKTGKVAKAVGAK